MVSVPILHDALVVGGDLSFVEKCVFGAIVVAIDIDVLAAGNIVLAVLVGQDGHVVGRVLLFHLPVRPRHRRNAVFDLVLQIVVTLLKLLLVATLVVDLQGELLLLAILVG